MSFCDKTVPYNHLSQHCSRHQNCWLYEVSDTYHMNFSPCFIFLFEDSASNLKRVDLSHNYLESLSPDIKSDIFTDSLVSIKLNDNYWICDCHLRYKSIMYYIHTRNDNLKLSSHVHWEDNSAQYVSRAHCQIPKTSIKLCREPCYASSSHYDV